MDVVQIVHDHEEPSAWVAGAQPAEGLADVDHTLPMTEHPGEAVGMDVIEAQELFGAMGAPIRGAHAGWPAAARPSDTPKGAEFEATPLIEADYRRPRRTLTIEPADAFFSGRTPDHATSSRSAPAGR